MVSRVFILLMLFSSFSGFAQTGYREAAYLFNKKLGRGINYMGSKINNGYHHPLDFELVKRNKFTHIRIGSRVWQYTGSSPDFTIDPDKLASYKNAVDWALDHDLMVVMDPIHAWIEYSDEDLPKLKKLWEQIATQFKDYPIDRVAFEIFNEPRSYDIDLEAMLKGCINIIRAIPGNEERIVIVSGQSFSTRQALIDAFNNNIVFPVDDPFLIGTFHYYDPKLFTKQDESGGVTWADGGDDDPEWDEAIDKFQEVVDAANSWADVNNTEPLPVYLGEFGVNKSAPPDDRAKWLWWVKTVSEQMGFSNSIWNLYSKNLTTKGLGPWNSLQQNDPASRYLDQYIVDPYRSRYEGEKGEMTGNFMTEPWEGSSDDTLVSTYNGLPGDLIILPGIYIARSGEYDITVRFQNNDTGSVFVSLTSIANSQPVDSVMLKLPPSSNIWNSITVPLDFITANNSKIILKLESPAYSFHFDYLAVTKGLYYDNLYPSENVNGVIIGVPEKQERKTFFYPNPAKDRIFIRGNFNEWVLYSLQGKRVDSGSGNTADISRFEPGLYILKIDNFPYKILIN